MLEAAGGFRMPAAPSAEERQQQEARAALERIVPGLSQLDQIVQMLPHLDRLLREDLPSLRQAGMQSWERAGYQSVRALSAEVAKVYGVDPKDLPPALREDLGEAFARWIQGDRDRQTRYYRADDTLITEFVDRWKAAYVDPVRRSTQAPGVRTALTNAGLPPAPTPGGPPPPTPPPAPANEDEVHDRAFAAFAAATGAGRR